MDYLLPAQGTAFSIMTKPVGSLCNLHCTYCYYLEKKNLFRNSVSHVIDTDLLESFIRQYIEIQKVPLVTFVWQGGEPTLAGIDFFEKVIQFQNRHAKGKRIENAFQTNGVNLNRDWCIFLKEHNFLVGISIDGPEAIHDFYRKDKAGGSTFSKVMKGIELLKQYKVEFNTLSTVTRESSKYPLEIYRFLKEIGSTFIQFLPVVERSTNTSGENGLSLVNQTYTGKAEVTNWSVIPDDYALFLISIFDQWVRQDVGRHFIQLFDVTLANWIGQPSGLCIFSETCGTAMALEKNGELFSCDHFVYPEYRLGNIRETELSDLVNDPRQIEFGLLKRSTLPDTCMECDYRFACHGECPKHRFAFTPEGNSGLNYLCSAYKNFFSHVHPFMQYMAEQLSKKQPPSNVMGWIKHMENSRVHRTTPKMIGRNDPCPCGSGKKYKNCCLKGLLS